MSKPDYRNSGGRNGLYLSPDGRESRLRISVYEVTNRPHDGNQCATARTLDYTAYRKGSLKVRGRILLVDLNNFARYPSVAIGYLTAILRAGDYDVELLAPLATGVGGVPREPRSPWWGRLDLEFRYRTAVSRNRLLRQVRAQYAAYHASKLARSRHALCAEFERRLQEGFDAVLVSTYLMYYSHCAALGEICRRNGVPLLLGGPYFASHQVAREWLDLPGLAALVGGEVEPHLCELVRRVIARESTDDLPGVWAHEGGLPVLNAPPLADLDSLPFPDYSQFPWSKYPNTIVPMITGRGCGWGVCTFCSDVTSTVGRTFRSRSPDNVLAELAHQHSRHGARMFVFTDLKLNSDLDVWHALGQKFQKVVPGARWIGAVHVGSRGENGLSLDGLRRARAAGMVRLTTGFESGSQRVLDRMAKGVDLGLTSQFLANAHKADISVRMTMITGFPGERTEDVDATTTFLERNEQFIERIPIYRFQIMTGTRFAERLERKPQRYSGISDITPDHRYAQVGHQNAETANPRYRSSISRLLGIVHRINRKPMRRHAQDFEGVM